MPRAANAGACSSFAPATASLPRDGVFGAPNRDGDAPVRTLTDAERPHSRHLGQRYVDDPPLVRVERLCLPRPTVAENGLGEGLRAGAQGSVARLPKSLALQDEPAGLNVVGERALEDVVEGHQPFRAALEQDVAAAPEEPHHRAVVRFFDLRREIELPGLAELANERPDRRAWVLRLRHLLRSPGTSTLRL